MIHSNDCIMNAILQFSLSEREVSQANSLSANIQSGFSFLREGLHDAIDRTGDCFSNHIVTPVNNFIKDLTQMEQEFKKVQESENEFRLCINGQYLTAREVLNLPMEENY